MAGTIVDLVKQDSRLQSELKELLKAKYLAPGIFHPEAYLVDTDKIDRKWKSRGRVKSRISTLAVGVAIYNQFYADVYACVAAGDDPMATPETSNWLNEWEEFVEEQYPDEAEEILASASNIGQYLEFMNRKSQGF